jgi:PPOX class probable F420-dependent enzyme
MAKSLAAPGDACREQPVRCLDQRGAAMVRPVRTNLAVEELGDLLDRPLVAVLATLRMDGSVLLSPVYHEWRDGGFNIWVEQRNVKARHLRRDPRATILVAESDPPLRAVEVRGRARFIEEGVPRPRCAS